MKNFLYRARFILLIVLTFSCKKKTSESNYGTGCYPAKFYMYSNDTFPVIKQHLTTIYPVGPFWEYLQEKTWISAFFNPNNDFEIVYSTGIPDVLEKEIWKYSFCTNQAIKLVSDQYYGLDYSSKGWVLYTGTGHKIYKVKDNGDSLMLLTPQSGYNRAGKWNPSGTLFWNDRDDGVSIHDDNGNVIKIISTNPFEPFDWVNDSTLIGWRNYNFYSMNIYTEDLANLNNKITQSPACRAYSSKENACFVIKNGGQGQDDFLLKYSLDGSNIIDTVDKMYDSYMYIPTDVSHTNRVIGRLDRQFWKDSTTYQIYRYWQIGFFDLENKTQRIVNLP